MSIGYAVGNKYLTAAATSQLSVAKAFANAVGAGSLLVAVEFWVNVNEAQTFTDNNTNTWVTAVSNYDSSLAQGVTIGYAKNAHAGATTVTCASASTLNRTLITVELTGADTTSPVDGTPTSANGTSASNPDPGSIITTGAGIVIGAATIYPTDTPTPGAGYTSQFAGTWAQYPMAVEDQITTAGGSFDPNWATSENFWAAVGIAFKSAAGSAPPVIGQPIGISPSIAF